MCLLTVNQTYQEPHCYIKLTTKESIWTFNNTFIYVLWANQSCYLREVNKGSQFRAIAPYNSEKSSDSLCPHLSSGAINCPPWPLTSYRRRDEHILRGKTRQRKADEHLEVMKTLRMLGPTLSPEPAVFHPAFHFLFSSFFYNQIRTAWLWHRIMWGTEEKFAKGRTQTQTHPKCGACAEDDAGGRELEMQHAVTATLKVQLQRIKAKVQASKITLWVIWWAKQEKCIDDYTILNIFLPIL